MAIAPSRTKSQYLWQGWITVTAILIQILTIVKITRVKASEFFGLPSSVCRSVGLVKLFSGWASEHRSWSLVFSIVDLHEAYLRPIKGFFVNLV